MNRTATFSLFLILFLSIFSNTAFAYDFYWSGNYSSEANYFSGVDLGNSSDGDKSYINHHLFLQPEVILYSGLSIKGAFDIINSGSDTLPSSQRVGQILGGGLIGSGKIVDQDPVFIDRIIERNRGLNINEAYLEYAHTAGTLIVGRFPLHFGLGAFYNEGHDVFDHWFTNRDGFAYDFQFGNLFFKPMFSFISDSLQTDGGRIIEYGLEFHFKVPDTGLDLGAMVLQRGVTAEANQNSTLGATQGAARPIFLSLFYERTAKNYRYGFEGFFQTGDIGEDASGDNVSIDGLGIALEGEFKLGKWDLSAKAGYASGDDPTDTDYSAVAFNRNYNLGLILFNHPLGTGTYDPTQTNARGRVAGNDPANFVASQTADTDAISNTLYFAPSFNYNFNDAWALDTTLVFAWLAETAILPSGNEVSSYLGSELDLTLTYNLTKNILFNGTFAFLLPGAAFEGDGSLENDIAFGSTVSLGITF